MTKYVYLWFVRRFRYVVDKSVRFGKFLKKFVVYFGARSWKYVYQTKLIKTQLTTYI